MKNSEQNNKIVLTSRISELEQSIKENKSEIIEKIEAIKDSLPPIKKEKYLWGAITKLDTKGSLEALYEKLKKLSEDTYSAFDNTNTYVSSVLELMRLLAATEDDLYTLLDNQSASGEDLAKSVERFLKKNKINDKSSGEVIKRSANRIITLRNRINELRNYIQDNFVDKLAIEQIREEFQKSVREEVSNAKIVTIDKVQNLLEPISTELSKQLTIAQVKDIIRASETNIGDKVSQMATPQNVRELLEPISTEIAKQLTIAQVKDIVGSSETNLGNKISQTATPQNVRELLEPISTEVAKQLTIAQVKDIIRASETNIGDKVSQMATPQNMRELLEPIKEHIEKIDNNIVSENEIVIKQLNDSIEKHNEGIKKQLIIAYVIAGIGLVTALTTLILLAFKVL